MQLDAVEGAVGFEVRRLIDETALVALLGFHDFEVFEDFVALGIEEEATAGLLDQRLQRALACGERRFAVVDDSVDGRAGALAHVDGDVYKRQVRTWRMCTGRICS